MDGRSWYEGRDGWREGAGMRGGMGGGGGGWRGELALFMSDHKKPPLTLRRDAKRPPIQTGYSAGPAGHKVIS